MTIQSQRLVLILSLSCTALGIGAASRLLAETAGDGQSYCEKDKCYGGNECRDAGTDQTGCQEYGPFGAFCRTYDCDAT